MPDHELTSITVVLDKSGSMGSVRDVTISAFNEYLGDQRRLPGRCELSLTLFDTEVHPRHLRVPVAEVPDLDARQYVPGGRTALYDAVGSTIDALGRDLDALPEDARPGRVLMVVQTDGQENSSREYDADRVHRLIRQQTDQWSWGFLFLGADQDAWLASQAIGIPRESSISYGGDAAGTQVAYEALGRATAAYRRGAAAVVPEDDRDLRRR